MTDESFAASLTQLTPLPTLAGLDRDQRCAAMLGAYGQAVLDVGPAPINLLNFNELPAALLVDVPARFGITTTVVEQARIADASRIYSKDPSRRVVFDADRERRERCVTDWQREIDLRYTQPVYAALEQCRARLTPGCPRMDG